MSENNPLEALGQLQQYMHQLQSRYEILLHGVTHLLGVDPKVEKDMTVLALVEKLAGEMGKPVPPLIEELKESLQTKE